jgi:thiamine pyrophosphokinase
MYKAVIFGASMIKDYGITEGHIDNDSLIICADGGASHAFNLGISPHIIIGDFDSYDDSRHFPEARILRFAPDKDLTDTELAIMEAVRAHVSQITLFGCMYGRMDQTAANVQLLLKYTRLGVDIKMIGEDDIILVANKPIKIKKKPGYYISLFAMSQIVEELTLRGTRYPLERYMLRSGDAIGVSNEFEAGHADICFLKGELLIILSRKKEH